MSPAAMVMAVVLTANHYVVDALAGAAVAGVGWWVAYSVLPALSQRMSSAGDVVTQLAIVPTPQPVPVRVESQQVLEVRPQCEDDVRVSA